MTYRSDFIVPAELMEQVAEQGLEILPELIRIVINAAMQAERSEHLQAESYQHTSEHRGYANGFKPKTLRTRDRYILYNEFTPNMTHCNVYLIHWLNGTNRAADFIPGSVWLEITIMIRYSCTITGCFFVLDRFHKAVLQYENI